MSEKPQTQRKQTMHADRQLITNAQQEAKEDARRIDRRVDALVIELTDLQRDHTALLVQEAAELEAAEARIRQEARTLAEPQELVAAETPQAESERLRKVLDEVRTNQAEHAANLDRLEHRTDALRANSAADRLLTRKNAEQVKEWCDTIEAHRVWLQEIEKKVGASSENTGAVLADILGRLEALEVKDIQRSADIATANKAADRLAQSSKDLWRKVWKIEEAIDAMKYRRMVGNLFRRVADAVDGG